MLADWWTTVAASSGATAGLLALVAVLVTVDAILPVLPSETAVVSAGVLAASPGRVPLAALIGVVAVAAVAGDLLAFAVGRRHAATWDRHRERRTRRGAALRWASAALSRNTTALVASARFVPGGRTAVTLSAGAMRLPWRLVARCAAVGALAWASAFSLLGFAGGRVFADNLVLALLAGVLAVGVATGFAELARWALGRRAVRSATPGAPVTG